MKTREVNNFNYFELKPLKPAKISEISEATASAPIPAEEKVNFHIGNPAQDEQLVNLFYNLVLFGNASTLRSNSSNVDQEDSSTQKIYDLVYNTIVKSVPYMPRGGYSSKSPNELILQFRDWLEVTQQEPLEYSIGKEGIEREVCLITGGIYEVLRILLLALSKHLLNLPAHIYYKGIAIPEHLKSFSGLLYEDLEDKHLTDYLTTFFAESKEHPVFLLLGKIPSETTRRKLRNLSVEFPLFIIEINDAPNHLSLAREAKMKNRVIRFLSPAVFSKKLKNSPVHFAIGNSEYIKLLETITFQIKGTPASAEVELLSFVIKHSKTLQENSNPANQDELNYSSPGNKDKYDYYSDKYFKSENIITKVFEYNLNPLFKKIEHFGEHISHLSYSKFNYNSPFMSHNSEEVIKKLITGFESPDIHKEIENSFLSEFIKLNYEYEFNDTLVVSGSARTALSLIGFHCGLAEVVTPDFSWTYEHCFPNVRVIPLDNKLQIDAEAIINFVKKKVSADSEWKTYGAVVLNNPHNASGKVFDSGTLSSLLKWLLENEIYVIDDLSYKNVAPSVESVNIPTLKSLALDLSRKGYISSYHLNRLITVQSVSKTDCYAGARVAVINVPDKKLHKKLSEYLSYVAPNTMALLLSYLFYRNENGKVSTFWNLRNRIFEERVTALEEAVNNLPAERNLFDINILRPTGSMYPAMIINKLPDGLSLDWISSGLAKEGIGLVPLTTFSRTAEGYDIARKTFRLTLGGKDNPETLLWKTRRVLIDLNYMISEENSRYNKSLPAIVNSNENSNHELPSFDLVWREIEAQLLSELREKSQQKFREFFGTDDPFIYYKKFQDEHLPQRLSIFKTKLKEKLQLAESILNDIRANGSKKIIARLEKEFYKDDLAEKQTRFRQRLFDRTVHPTQMYSLKTDILITELTNKLVFGNKLEKKQVSQIGEEILKEFLGVNVGIKSVEESYELLDDLSSLNEVENYFAFNCDNDFQILLSFWGDWDGSTRPSGQGHRLVAAALVENVTQQCRLYNLLKKHKRNLKVDPNLEEEIETLQKTNARFWSLLNEITTLTNQLEKRYKTLLPYSSEQGRVKKLTVKLHISKDPLTSLFEHNDRLERKMFELRSERRRKLEYYFGLNKRLRKTLNDLLPEIKEVLKIPEVGIQFGMYRNILRRFVLTPRIHQKTITARDQFTINTTVHNLMEINEIAGKYGNPGMILGLQISMSTSPEALISADRKFIAEAEEVSRISNNTIIPKIWIIPLFEDIDNVKNINNYLLKVWDYALQSRKVNQTTEERFTEFVCEIFIAGSDLSQQIGQTASAELYKKAKYEIIRWLAERGFVESVRMKLGSGEPMQRQGGYYSPESGKKAFVTNELTHSLLRKHLKDSTRKSTEYATSPLMGILSSGDLRTFQSNIAEKMKLISLKERSELLYQIKELQKNHQENLIRSTEPLTGTRLRYQTKGLQDLERITMGKKDEVFARFVELTQENFRQILYGSENDVIGIHVISYFISRTTPQLRDRPTVRPTKESVSNQGQKILERISEMIPLQKHGTLLRAIGHNKAQSAVLGYNQLTTGLFRAMKLFCNEENLGGNPYQILSDRILPYLPVYEILESLRLFHDPKLEYIDKLQRAFPAGNSSLIKLREDVDSFYPFIGLMQKELLRRHGLNVSEFFEGVLFNKKLLPTLRPDLAVLLQHNIFNTSVDALIEIENFDLDTGWTGEVRLLLNKPAEIRKWRSEVWLLLLIPIYEQVESFNQLAVALYNLSSKTDIKEFKLPPLENRKTKPGMSGLFQGAVDDTMQQFLSAAVQYLSNLPQDSIEIPLEIVRAMKDVKKILLIEKQALKKPEQEKLTFLLLQIARIAGENG